MRRLTGLLGVLAALAAGPTLAGRPAAAGGGSGDDFRAAGAVELLAFSADGKRLAARSADGVTLWDATSGRAQRRLALTGYRGGLLAWRADGRGVLLLHDRAGDPLLVDFADEKLEVPPRVELPEPKGPVPAAGEVAGPYALSADGRVLAAGRSWGGVEREHAVVVRAIATGKRVGDLKEVRALKAQKGDCSELCLTADGTALGVFARGGGNEDVFVLWDLRTGKERARRSVPSHLADDGRLCAALSPDGAALAVGLGDGRALLFPLAGDAKPRAFTGPGPGGVTAVAFSPDGRRVVTAGPGRGVRLWDAAKLKEVRVLAEAGERVAALAFSPDGGRVAAGGESGQVWVWDAATGKPAGR